MSVLTLFAFSKSSSAAIVPDEYLKAAPIMPEPNVPEVQSAQACRDDEAPQNSDDELMVYETPHDYATQAREQRERLIKNGADPASIVLQSEIGNHVPRQEGEAPVEYSQRFVECMGAMLARGVVILNDMSTADVVPSGFGTADGRTFDLGPGSGATKREFREFTQWFEEALDEGVLPEVPEKWKKFQKPIDP
jgi:hypothetical protein